MTSGEPFEGKVARLTAQRREQRAEVRRLDSESQARPMRFAFWDH